MAVWVHPGLWSVLLLITGAEVPGVDYPRPVCAVRGSTVTLPCTFTTPRSVSDNGSLVLTRVLRVVWCRNHEICHGSTPSVFDSEERNNRNHPRYRYLGDRRSNCTLQVSDVQKDDDATLRFRVEADHGHATFTGRRGVRLTVTDSTPVEIRSSGPGAAVTAGEAVTLTCTAPCTFHRLEVTWLRDDHALRENGPALRLSALTAGDSGNYTCGLQSVGAASRSYSLRVEAAEAAEAAEATGQLFLIVGVAFGVLTAVFTLTLISCLIKRRRTAAGTEPPEGGDAGLKRPDHLIYSNVEQEGDDHQHERSVAVDDVSYAAVQFRPQNQARTEEEEDAIIYSAVASRG